MPLVLCLVMLKATWLIRALFMFHPMMMWLVLSRIGKEPKVSFIVSSWLKDTMYLSLTAL